MTCSKRLSVPRQLRLDFADIGVAILNRDRDARLSALQSRRDPAHVVPGDKDALSDGCLLDLEFSIFIRDCKIRMIEDAKITFHPAVDIAGNEDWKAVSLEIIHGERLPCGYDFVPARVLER